MSLPRYAGISETEQGQLGQAIERFILAGGSATDVLDRLDDFGLETEEGVWHLTPEGFRQAIQSFRVGEKRMGRDRRDRRVCSFFDQDRIPHEERMKAPGWAKPLA